MNEMIILLAGLCCGACFMGLYFLWFGDKNGKS